ncbi:hypothetical protein LCGC14_0981020 [marine sediment metagenome]|uniref:HNH endonuclease n=1 Tax=marine sediment metagenome TaxID=412755 RepID=A0A0F9ND71_9ZZZZ
MRYIRWHHLNRGEGWPHFRKGALNPQWKGDDVGYGALHEWIRGNKPKPELCEDCGEHPPFEVMNIIGEYKRDVSDFKWVCRACHMKEDGRMSNLRSATRIEILLP